jgi:hypothetical protein
LGNLFVIDAHVGGLLRVGGEFGTFVKENGVKCIPGTRSVIVVDVEQVGSSCGFSVPFYEFKGFRSTLNDFFKKKQDEDMVKYGSPSFSFILK